METETINLGDIPDLSGIATDDRPAAFEDGWYEGTILAKREFTDSNGNDRVFESGDTAAQRSGRNIRLQVVLKRQTDGRTLNTSTLVNYQPEDLTSATIQAVAAQKEKVKDSGEQWGSLFRSYMTLNRLGTLQKIAGVRSFQRSADGSLDLTPLYGKIAYFKLGPDDRNPAYKAVKNFSDAAPKGKKASLL